MIQYNPEDAGLELVGRKVARAFRSKGINDSLLYVWGAKEDRPHKFYLNFSIPKVNELYTFLTGKGIDICEVAEHRGSVSLGIRWDMRMPEVQRETVKVVKFVLLHLNKLIRYPSNMELKKMVLEPPRPNANGDAVEQELRDRVRRGIVEARPTGNFVTVDPATGEIIPPVTRRRRQSLLTPITESVSQDIGRQIMDWRYTFRSRSNSNDTYETIARVPFSLAHGNWEEGVVEISCNCRGWIYNRRGNRTCVHTESVRTILRRRYSGSGVSGDSPQGRSVDYIVIDEAIDPADERERQDEERS